MSGIYPSMRQDSTNTGLAKQRADTAFIIRLYTRVYSPVWRKAETMYKQAEEKKKERNFYHKTHGGFLSVLTKT